MSIDFCYEDAPPTGTLRRIANDARERRLRFYGRMKRNWYVPPPPPEPEPIIEPEPEPIPAPAIFTRRPPGFDQIPVIQKYVAARYGMTPDELMTPSSQFRFSHPRQIAMFFTKEFTTRSVTAIGKIFGGRDHSTAIHAIKKTREREGADLVFAAEIAEMRAGLKAILS